MQAKPATLRPTSKRASEQDSVRQYMSRPVSPLDYARAFAHRGEALLDLDLQAEALISFERALGFDPRFLPAHLGLAKTMLAMGQDQSALQIYQRLCRDPFVTSIDASTLKIIEASIQDIHDLNSAQARKPSPSLTQRFQSQFQKFQMPTVEASWYKRAVPVLGVAIGAALLGPWLEHEALQGAWFDLADSSRERTYVAQSSHTKVPSAEPDAFASPAATIADEFEAKANVAPEAGSIPPSSGSLLETGDRTSTPLRYRPHLPSQLMQQSAGKTVRHLDGLQRDRIANYIVEQFRSNPSLARAVVHEAVVVGKQLNIDPLLLLAIIAVESRFDPMAQSTKGAQGLMQVRTSVHSSRFDAFGGTGAAFDFATNMRIGAQILQEHLRRYGSVDLALKHYVGAAKMAHDQGYAAKVREAKSKLEAIWSQSGVVQATQASSG